MGKRNEMINFMPWSCRYCIQGYKGMVHVSNEANAQGLVLTELKWQDAEQAPTYAALAEKDPVFFNGFGHGNAKVFTGDSERIVFLSDDDLSILSGRIVYLLSCMTAIVLGPTIINYGGIAYGGYNISWTWMCRDITADPYDDFLAESFYKSSNEFPIAMIQGETVQEAKVRCLAMYNHWIDIWETDRAGDSNAAQVLKWMLYDRNGLVVLGDYSATITEDQGGPAMVTFNGQVSAQAAAGEEVTVEITQAGSPPVQAKGLTQADLTYSIEYIPPGPGSYTAQASIGEDADYLPAKSEVVPFEIEEGGEKLPRTINLDVMVRPNGL